MSLTLCSFYITKKKIDFKKFGNLFSTIDYSFLIRLIIDAFSLFLPVWHHCFLLFSTTYYKRTTNLLLPALRRSFNLRKKTGSSWAVHFVFCSTFLYHIIKDNLSLGFYRIHFVFLAFVINKSWISLVLICHSHHFHRAASQNVIQLRYYCQDVWTCEQEEALRASGPAP